LKNWTKFIKKKLDKNFPQFFNLSKKFHKVYQKNWTKIFSNFWAKIGLFLIRVLSRDAEAEAGSG